MDKSTQDKSTQTITKQKHRKYIRKADKIIFNEITNDKKIKFAIFIANDNDFLKTQCDKGFTLDFS